VSVPAAATRVLAAVLAVLLGACGFRLQGATTLPAGVTSVYVATVDELTPFAVELRRGLDHAGARVAPAAGEADAVVRVAHDRTGQRVLSVSARNTPQEYQVYYVVRYSIERAGATVVPQQEIELTRSYSFSEADLLAKNREETILREAMARDLADLVLRRLATI
jgi:LPS-assembly lipoprotein